MFELSRNVLIGQYFPTNSAVHRLDPRTKILGTLFIVVAISLSRSLLASLLLLGLLVLITWLARLPFGAILRGLRYAAPLLAIFLVVQLVFLGWQPSAAAGPVFFEWQFIRVTRGSLQQMGLGIVRLLSFYFIAGLPTLTTTVTQLTHGVELLLRPLRRVGLPAAEIALVNMIALRFVPTLAEELERVMKAQASRCGEIGTRLQRPDRLARALLPLVVPLFVNAFRRAEELAIAMEARCYMGGVGRTKYVRLQATWVDAAVTAALLAICAVALWTPWPALADLFLGR